MADQTDKMVRVSDDTHSELYDLKRKDESYGELVSRLVDHYQETRS